MTKKTPYDLTSVFLFFVFFISLYLTLNIIRVSVDLFSDLQGIGEKACWVDFGVQGLYK